MERVRRWVRTLPFGLLLSVAACAEEQAQGPWSPPVSPSASGGAASQPDSPRVEGLDPAALAACDAGDRAFVHRAILALLGRRPLGQGEVEAVVGAIAQLRSYQEAAMLPDTARSVVARALMQEDAFRVRWSDFLKDSLRIARTEAKSQESCYGDHEAVVADGGELARFVRDSEATASNDSFRGFTMRELLASALELDDLSVVYRAHLFAMMDRPLIGNSLELELELARRNDFGVAFEAAYTRRDITCLACHNSEFSVTARTDPATNRFWPMPGLVERALFGTSTGLHAPEESEQKGSDVLRARGMFRYTGVVGEGTLPFGWSEACGRFGVPTTDDPLHIDTWFGSLRSLPEDPGRGQRMSVWELERSLRAGFEGLAAADLSSGEVTPDTAFAALVVRNIVENVWTEVVGTPLTITHHFPRTAVQRDLLGSLQDRFVQSRYSLKALLLEILEHGVFNLKAPSAGCGGAPYPFERLLDPWTDAESEPTARGNGPSDGVFPLPPRVLRRSLYTALDWPMYREYPAVGSPEETLSLAVGFFLRDSEPGHKGLDFQGRLAWEAAYGSCPAAETDDFIARLARAAEGEPSATVFDAVVALKDRLVGEPHILESERAPLEALLGSSLDAPPLFLDAGLRRLCGALVSSPMFMLGGMVPDATFDIPKLTPDAASEATVCRKLGTALTELKAGIILACPE